MPNLKKYLMPDTVIYNGDLGLDEVQWILTTLDREALFKSLNENSEWIHGLFLNNVKTSARNIELVKEIITSNKNMNQLFFRPRSCDEKEYTKALKTIETASINKKFDYTSLQQAIKIVEEYIPLPKALQIIGEGLIDSNISALSLDFIRITSNVAREIVKMTTNPAIELTKLTLYKSYFEDDKAIEEFATIFQSKNLKTLNFQGVELDSQSIRLMIDSATYPHKALSELILEYCSISSQDAQYINSSMTNSNNQNLKVNISDNILDYPIYMELKKNPNIKIQDEVSSLYDDLNDNCSNATDRSVRILEFVNNSFSPKMIRSLITSPMPFELDLNARDNQGLSLLDHFKTCPDITELLIDHGAIL